MGRLYLSATRFGKFCDERHHGPSKNVRGQIICAKDSDAWPSPRSHWAMELDDPPFRQLSSGPQLPLSYMSFCAAKSLDPASIIWTSIAPCLILQRIIVCHRVTLLAVKAVHELSKYDQSTDANVSLFSTRDREVYNQKRMPASLLTPLVAYTSSLYLRSSQGTSLKLMSTVPNISGALGVFGMALGKKKKTPPAQTFSLSGTATILGAGRGGPPPAENNISRMESTIPKRWEASKQNDQNGEPRSEKRRDRGSISRGPRLIEACLEASVIGCKAASTFRVK